MAASLEVAMDVRQRAIIRELVTQLADVERTLIAIEQRLPAKEG